MNHNAYTNERYSKPLQQLFKMWRYTGNYFEKCSNEAFIRT